MHYPAVPNNIIISFPVCLRSGDFIGQSKYYNVQSCSLHKSHTDLNLVRSIVVNLVFGSVIVDLLGHKAQKTTSESDQQTSNPVLF